MRVVIISGSFFPNIHPRAFRATELAKEFSRQGHEVTAVFFKKDESFNYAQYEKDYKLNLVAISLFGNRSAKVAAHKKNILFKLERLIIEYFFCGNLFKHSKRIETSLSSLDCMKTADLVIALSTPFPIHYGFYKYIKTHPKGFVAIGDSGDPFYYSKQTSRALWFKYIEKNVYASFDYLTIPTANATNLYTRICPESKIKIIPQGFDMKNLKLHQGEPSGIVSFAYAGVFYWDIRNPEFFFRFLNKVDVDFRFYIYMRYPDSKFDAVINSYPKLKKKISIKYAVPHDDLIYELSRMHFLINIENISNTQMPSKLIDYGMTSRPIFSCKESTFSEEKMKAFLSGNYDGKYEVNIQEYNIELITEKFLELAQLAQNG